MTEYTCDLCEDEAPVTYDRGGETVPQTRHYCKKHAVAALSD